MPLHLPFKQRSCVSIREYVAEGKKHAWRSRENLSHPRGTLLSAERAERWQAVHTESCNYCGQIPQHWSLIRPRSTEENTTLMTESKAEDQDLHYDGKQNKALSETIYKKKKKIIQDRPLSSDWGMTISPSKCKNHWKVRVTHLIIIPEHPAQALHVRLHHFLTKLVVCLVHVELRFVVTLLPTVLP